MADREQAMIMALNLMDQALELLDDSGESLVAAHLQHAIDVARGAPIPRTAEEVEEMLNSPEVRAFQNRLNR